MHASRMPKVPRVVVAAAVWLAACSNPSTAGTGSGSAAPDVAAETRGAVDDTLHVPLSQSARADEGRLVVTFVARLSDSRCPANVVCVWMGDAALRVSARSGRTIVERVVHTGIEPRGLSVGKYTVTVVGLTPYPGTADTSTPTAVLRVVRD